MSAQPDRKQYIGGSDVAAILGLSPWRTPLQVWSQKTGQDEPTPLDPDRERLFRRGKLMEPVVVDMLIAEHNVMVTKRSRPDAPNRYVDTEHSFLAAEIDFEWEVNEQAIKEFGEKIPVALIGLTANGEVKTVHPFGAGIYGEEHTDEIPIYHAAQAMHGLMVTGRALTMFPVLVGSDNLLLYWVRRDEETIAGMREKLVAFWCENVEKGVAPEPSNLPDIYRLFKRRPATKIEATPAVASMIQTLRILKSRESVTQEAIEAVQFEIGTFILGAEAMENPGAKDKGKHVVTVGGREELTIAYQEQQRIDADALRLKYPAQAKECEKTSTFYKFNLKRTKP